MTKSTVTVGVHEAKTRLSQLLRLVDAGEEVEIQRNGEPVARLVPRRAGGPGSSGSIVGHSRARGLRCTVGACDVLDDFEG